MSEHSYHHKNLKNTLIQEGIHYINEYGEKNLSMRKLASLCNVSHTALYKHFRSKEDFMYAISDYIETLFTEALVNARNRADGDVDEAIIQIGIGYVAFMFEHPDFMKYHINTMKSKMYEFPTMEDASTSSFEVFRSTAIAFLQKHGYKQEEYYNEILFMWSIVMGLSNMFAYEIIDARGDGLKKVEAIIRREIQLHSRNTI